MTVIGRLFQGMSVLLPMACFNNEFSVIEKNNNKNKQQNNLRMQISYYLKHKLTCRRWIAEILCSLKKPLGTSPSLI